MRVAQTYARRKNVVFAWGMGMTHHLHGVENVEAIANLALLRGMIGRPFAGLLPLRGHSNVQGDRTVGITEKPAEAMLERLDAAFGIRSPREHGHDAGPGDG